MGGYTDHEIDLLSRAAKTLNPIQGEDKRRILGRKLLETIWPDPWERQWKTHWILDNRVNSPTFGNLVRLVPNHAQRKLVDMLRQKQQAGEPIRFIILKARQLGFSTFVQSWHYALCDYIDNCRSMTISYDEDSTVEMFQKARTIHNQLWFPRKSPRSRGNIMEFDNGSVFYTATAGKLSAGRSYTIHRLHCSEVPMWPNSQEVLTAVLQAVPLHPDTSVILESTAKGAVGSFYEMWKGAERSENAYTPFFAPWHWDPSYTFPFRDEDQRRSFAREKMKPEDWKYKKRHKLSLEQMAWRYWKTRDGLENNPAKFKQEFPADADEAFLTTGSPRFSAEAVAALSQQCTQPKWRGDIWLET